MAPSPTGELHVGSFSIALKDYAWAKRNNGHFVLRIEDTDQEREVEGAIERIQEILSRFNLSWDEGPGVGGPHEPYIQSKRLSIYQERAQQLISEDKAYYCFCSRERLAEVREKDIAAKKPPMYDKHCRSISKDEAQARVDTGETHVVRLKVPADVTLSFTDLIRGEITFNSNTVDDQVLLKSDGFPTYHLAVVVDDQDMEITHVFRGEEWISSTPKHILLYHAFDWPMPVFCHFPIYLNPDGKGKMSKRKGAVSVESFLQRGYLPDALLNFLMILGWAPKDEQEIMSLERYVQEFDPADVSAKSVVFDIKKLDWLNGQYIRKMSDDDLSDALEPFLPADFPKDKMAEILPLIKERLVTLTDIEELTDFFYRELPYEPELLLKKGTSELVMQELDETIAAMDKVEDWNLEAIEVAVRKLQENHDWHRGQYFMMLRIAATSKKFTPPLFETLEVLGKEAVISRLRKAKASI